MRYIYNEIRAYNKGFVVHKIGLSDLKNVKLTHHTVCKDGVVLFEADEPAPFCTDIPCHFYVFHNKAKDIYYEMNMLEPYDMRNDSIFIYKNDTKLFKVTFDEIVERVINPEKWEVYF